MSRLRYSFGPRLWEQSTPLSDIRARNAPGFQSLLKNGSHVAVIGLFALAAIAAMQIGSAYLVPVCCAVLVGLTLGPIVDWLEHHGINRYIASALIMLAVGGAFAVLLIGLSGAIEEWARRIPQMWHRATEEFRFLREALQGVDETLDNVFDVTPEGSGDEVQEVVITEGSVMVQMLATVPTIGGQIIAFLGTLFFFLASRTGIRHTVLSFCMRASARLRTARIFRDVEFYLSRYVASITLVNMGLGLATAIAMAMIGVPSPILWGVLAAFLNFVPYLGPLVMAVILGGVGLVTHTGLAAALLPAAVFLGLNFIEAQFVTPAVIGRALTINPLSVFLALTFWLWMWGPIGALIAVPMLIIAIVVLMHLLPRHHAATVRRPVGRRRVAPATAPELEPGATEPAPVVAPVDTVPRAPA